MALESQEFRKTFVAALFMMLEVFLPCSAVAEFRVGLILPLTGPATEYGLSMKNSIELARLDNPKNFEKISYLLEDSKNDAKTAVSAFQKLVLRDKIQLLYIWGVAPCAAVLPLADIHKVPTIAQCYDERASAGRKYVIRFMNKTEDYMRVLTAALKAEGKERIGVILSETPFIEEMFEGFQRALQNGQKIDLVGRFHLSETDMRVAVSKLKNSKNDSLAVLLALGQVAAFFRQAREQNLNLPAYGTISFESGTEIRSAEGALEGAKFAGNVIRESYRDRYRERFSTESQLSFGALAYEFSRLVGELFSTEREWTANQILDGFRLRDDRLGVAVPWMRFVGGGESNEGEHFEFPLEMRKVSGGSTTSLEPRKEETGR